MKHRFPVIVLFFFLVVVEQGCDLAARHKALTFFFDGVPPLGSVQEEVSVPGEETSQRRRRERGDLPERPMVTTFQHVPYAMKMCDGCHNVGKSDSSAPMGFSLLEERTKLCAMCHNNYSQKELGNTYEWLHGPAQYGACLECHHPHESMNPYMIIESSIQTLCFKCHFKDRLLKTVIHEDINETECTVCHDPHGSQMRYMLRM